MRDSLSCSLCSRYTRLKPRPSTTNQCRQRLWTDPATAPVPSHKNWRRGVKKKKGVTLTNRESGEETVSPPLGHVWRMRLKPIDVNEPGWHGRPSL